MSKSRRNRSEKQNKQEHHMKDNEKTKIYKTNQLQNGENKTNLIDEEKSIISPSEHVSKKRMNRKKRRLFKRQTQFESDHVIEEQTEKRRSEKNKRHNKPLFIIKRTFVIVGIFIVLVLIGYTTILYGGKLLVDDERLTITPPTTIETEDGEIIWYLYDEFRLPVAIEQVPDHVKEAFIAIEDRRFYDHAGVDFRSIMRAVYRDIITRSRAEGASTITQQLAKNLFLTNEKTFLRKTKEMMIALHLEREFTKDEILEMYLNVVYFGQGQYGIEAAANKFFYKSVDELSIEEGALLAGLVKAPNSYSPIDHLEKAQDRRNVVLYAMADVDVISEEEASQLKNKDVQLNISDRKLNVAHHTFIDLVIKEAEEKYGLTLEDLRRHRYKITTSLRPEFQEIAYEYFQYDNYFPGNNDDVEGAFLLMDQEDGKIVSAIGGRHYRISDLNRIYVKRQPGSTLKPLAVFAPALMSNEFEPYSMIPDEKREWEGHTVHNHDDQYEGQVSLYNALKHSKNTSAYWLLNELGIDYAKSYLNKMDMSIEDEGLSIALGGLKTGVTPLQLVQAYRTFIHEGKMINAHAIMTIHDYKGDLVGENTREEVEVFTPQVAWTMTEILKAVVDSGTGRSGDYPHELAGKTGTTEHPHADGFAKDAWFVGMTPEYVSALWMGYDRSDKNNYLTSGSSNPTILTKNILSEINKHTALATTFVKPEGVQSLEEPINMPMITDVDGTYIFGGLKLLKGKLTWDISNHDERIIYRIYKHSSDEAEFIGEVVGESEFIIESVSLFRQDSYYIVPFNPLTQIEGEPSELIELSF